MDDEMILGAACSPVEKPVKGLLRGTGMKGKFFLDNQ
jgi:hypothetical protein